MIKIKMIQMFMYIICFIFLWYSFLFVGIRFFNLYGRHEKEKGKRSNHKNKKKEKREVGVVLGSGGHTFEMINLLRIVESENIKFHLFYAKNDFLSRGRAERQLLKSEKNFIAITRCRNVGESYFIAFIKFIFVLIHCIYVTTKMTNMNTIIVNGPSTCLPVVFSLVFRKYILLQKIKVVYFESACRVTSLSLTGKLLYFFSDLFVVFSQYLAAKYKKAKYYGYLF